MQEIDKIRGVQIVLLPQKYKRVVGFRYVKKGVPHHHSASPQRVISTNNLLTTNYFNSAISIPYLAYFNSADFNSAISIPRISGLCFSWLGCDILYLVYTIHLTYYPFDYLTFVACSNIIILYLVQVL